MRMTIDREKIEQQVKKILTSSQFKNSQVLSDFFSYIVNETMTGAEETLKEYVIATNVLKKKTDFNPQLNDIVRIHSRRL